MADFDFDLPVERTGTDSLKFDFAERRGHAADELPLWVADMDFPAPREVLDALQQRVSHGIFGYTETGHDYYQAVSDWMKERCGWTPRETWLVKTPGVVYALAMAVRAFSEKGDRVVIQPPVYYPFFDVIRDNGRIVEANELVERSGRYEMDLEDLERRLQGARIMFLCSPHNPVGRVWTREEVQSVAELCAASGTILVSDEIHCDFVRKGSGFTSAAAFSELLGGRLVVCTSPAKTFNLAGLQVSNIFIPDPSLRRGFRREISATGYSQLNTMGLMAGRAAYEYGGAWLDALLEYLEGNLELIRRSVAERMPGVRLVEPEGTYLAWLDFRGTGLSGDALDRFIRERARLWLDEGRVFGGHADMYQRINYATNRQMLGRALDQLAEALGSLQAETGAR